MQQSGENQGVRPPVPPFNEESARQKVKAAQDAWNTRDPPRRARSPIRRIQSGATATSSLRAGKPSGTSSSASGLGSWTTGWRRTSGASPRTASRSGSSTRAGMRRDNGGEVTSTTGLQHLPDLRLRVVLDRDSSRRSHRSDAGKARATLTLEGAQHDTAPSQSR